MTEPWDDLHDTLTGDLDFDAPVEEIDITGLDQVERYGLRLALLRADDDLDRSVASAETAKIRYWLDGRLASRASSIVWLEQVLARYHAQVLVDDPRRKTINLPSVTLKARAQVADWEFTDAFVEWAADALPSVLRQKVEVDRAAAKRSVMIADDGVAVTRDGELVPGVTVTDRPVKFSAVTGDE